MKERSITDAMSVSMKKADNFLFDYLAEFSASATSAPTLDGTEAEHPDDSVILVERPKSERRDAWYSDQTISARKRLAATISVSRDEASKRVRPKSESLLVLLQCLHFLNQPISESLRRSFLAAAEQSIDDYQSAQWEYAVSSCSGVPSEAAR